MTDLVLKRLDTSAELHAVYGLRVRAWRSVEEAAIEGERTGFERQLVTAGRPPIWIRVDYYPDRAASGRVRGLLVTYSDVDHLKRLELEAGQREHRLRLVTDSVGVPILYVDRGLKIRCAHRHFAETLGRARQRKRFAHEIVIVHRAILPYP